MAEPSATPTREEEVKMGVARACLMLPKDATLRRQAIALILEREEMEKEAVAEAKEEVNLKGALDTALKTYGVHKTALDFIKKLKKFKHGDAAAVLTQVALLARDEEMLDRDLVDLAEAGAATAGQQADDQKSIFDSTAAGKRSVGVETAQEKAARESREADEAARTAAAARGTGPGISLEEARKRLEEALAAQNAKGAKRKTKAVKEAEESVAAAERAAASGEVDREAGPSPVEGEGGDKAEEAPADTATESPETKADAPQYEPGSAAGDAFIREQSARLAAERDAKAAAAAAPEASADAPPAAPKRRARARLDDDAPPAAPSNVRSLRKLPGADTGTFAHNP